MGRIINAITANTDFFFLTFLRVSGLIISSPIFGRKQIPNMAKIAFCLTLSVMIFPLFPTYGPLTYTSVWSYLILCALELLFGIVLSYILNAFFMLVYTSGTLIDMQLGFGMVNVFDVQANIQVPLIGNMLNLMLLVFFFAVNGHLRLIEILSVTLQRVPVGHIAVDISLVRMAVEVFVRTFVLAVSVALPTIASGLVLECALGIIVRTVPQMNVFVVGFPLKIMIGFIILLVCIPIFADLSMKIFDEMFDFIQGMMGGFSAA